MARVARWFAPLLHLPMPGSCNLQRNCAHARPPPYPYPIEYACPSTDSSSNVLKIRIATGSTSSLEEAMSCTSSTDATSSLLRLDHERGKHSSEHLSEGSDHEV